MNKKEAVIQIVIGLVVGIVLGIGGTFFTLQSRITKLESKVENLQNNPRNKPLTPSQGTNQSSKGTPLSTNENPEKLIKMVQDAQRKNVKESCGEEAYENFTDEDLEKFKQDRVVDGIVGELEKDPEFLNVVLAIRGMTPGEQNKLLTSANKPLRRTWSELKEISCEGQTDAGKEAEIIIANGIVNFVKELLKINNVEFEKLYIQ